MGDEEFNVTEIKYKEQYNPLRAKICVYGINSKGFFYQSGIILPTLVIGYFTKRENVENISVRELEKNMDLNLTINPLVHRDKSRFTKTEKTKKLESILLQEMKRERIHVVEVDNPKKIEAVIKKHAEMFCKQYTDLGERLKKFYDAYLLERSSLNPFD